MPQQARMGSLGMQQLTSFHFLFQCRFVTVFVILLTNPPQIAYSNACTARLVDRCGLVSASESRASQYTSYSESFTQHSKNTAWLVNPAGTIVLALESKAAGHVLHCCNRSTCNPARVEGYEVGGGGPSYPPHLVTAGLRGIYFVPSAKIVGIAAKMQGEQRTTSKAAYL